jgi:enoyl-CoA hydratase/carnithine racemase/NADP-dependent 3-hydroxy acid dehydrogenase YdfG/aryl carrier-like protein
LNVSGNSVLGRHVKLFKEYKIDKNKEVNMTACGIKNRGLYLITGGAGGLGLTFARYLSKKYNANVILLGRSALEQEKLAQIEELNTFGGKVIYQRADISKYEEIANAVALSKKALFGTVSMQDQNMVLGIFHMAGVIDDVFVANKTTEKISRVLAPKVIGTLNISRLAKDEGTKFAVLFSSMSGVFGNYGQADYATGNAYMDEFAEYCCFENDRRDTDTRYLSINWPLWEDGGMHLTRDGEKIFLESTGIQILKPDAGIDIFEQLISSTEIHGQVAVMVGEKSKIDFLFERKKKQNLITLNEDMSLPKIQSCLLGMFCEVMGVSPVDVDPNANIQTYGLDSILGMKFFVKMKSVFKKIEDVSIIFTNPSISELAVYIFSNGTAARSLPTDISSQGSSEGPLEREKFVHEKLTLHNVSNTLSKLKIYTDPNSNTWIFLNNLPFNDVNLEVLEELSLVLQTQSGLCKNKIVYLTHFGKIFSLGGDRRYFLKAKDDKKQFTHFSEKLKKMMVDFSLLETILVGISQGNILGGGLELFSFMDFHFVTPDIKVGLPEIRSGLYPGMGGLSFFNKLLGPAITKKIAILEHYLSGKEAHACGIFSHVSLKPYEDAYHLANEINDMETALKIRKIVNSENLNKYLKDIDDWKDYVLRDSFAMSNAYIHDTYNFSGKWQEFQR